MVSSHLVLRSSPYSINDIPMFEASYECYAVSNAMDELKRIATGIIESNNDDGVAKWLNENCK